MVDSFTARQLTKQRRIVPQEDDYLRVLRSGERPPENMSVGGRIVRNAAVAIPRTVASFGQLMSMGAAGLEAGYGKLTGKKDFGQGFSDALYGEGTQKEMDAWTEEQANKIFRSLPKNKQTEVNADRIVATIQGSRSYEDKMLELGKQRNSPFLYYQGQANEINDLAGLNRASEETTTDSAIQSIATAALPISKAIGLTSAGVKGLTGLTTKAITGRLLKSAAEHVIVGSTGKIPNIATNTLVDMGIDQAIRGYTDAPSVFTGDENLAEELAAQRQREKEAKLQAGMHNPGPANFLAGSVPVGTTPAASARIAKVDHTVGPVTPLDPADEDPDGGFLGNAWVRGAGAAGLLAVALMAFRGRSPKGVIDLTTNEKFTMPGVARSSVTPESLLKDTPTPMSKLDKTFAQTIDDTHPMKKSAQQAVQNLSVDQQAQAAENLALLKYRASHQDVHADVNRWIKTGQMPDVSAVLPSFEDIDTATTRLSPQQQDLFFKGMQLKHLSNVHARQVNDLSTNLANLQQQAFRGKITKAQYYAEQARLRKLQDPMHELQPGMTVRDARTLMAQFDADPKLKAIEIMHRKVYNGVLEGVNRQGLMDHQSIQNLMRTGPNFVHQVEDSLGGVSGLQRLLKYAERQVAGRTQEGMYHKVRPVIRSTGELTGEEASRIKNPIDANSALRAYVKDYIEFTNHNNAVKYYMDMMSHSPDWGETARRAHAPVSVYEFNKQAKTRGTPIESLLADKRTVGYTSNGLVHLFQVHDPAIAQGLQFNPASALPIADWARRMTQAGFTTYNPAFALGKAASYDLFSSWANRHPDRPWGYLDMWNRKMFPNGNVLTALLKAYPDPTMAAHGMWVGSIGASRELLQLASKWVANDLRFGSGFWHQIAQMPGMDTVLNQVAEAGIRQYKDSWYSLLDEYGIKGHTYSPVAMDATVAKYDSLLKRGAFPRAMRGMVQGYKVVLDNFRNMQRSAQFFQEIALEMDKHPNGIPRNEFRKIVTRMKTSTGDMTNKPGSEGLQKAQSFFAYSNVTANSIAMMGQTLKRQPFGFGTRVFAGVVVPSLFMSWLLAQDKDTYEWYYNTLSTFERVANLPSIKPEYWLRIASGGDTKITPADIALEPMAQEFAVITSVFNTMARAAGMFEGDYGIGPDTGYQRGDPRITMSDARRQMPWGEIGAAITNLLPLQAPGLVQVLLGKKVNFGNVITGKPVVQSEVDDKSLGLSSPEGFTATLTDGLITMMGGVGSIFELAASPWSMKVVHDGNYLDAVKKTFSWAGYAVERSMSDYLGTGASIWTNGQRRRYATTPPRERVTAAKSIADELMKQRSAAKLNNPRFPDYYLPTIDPQTVQMSNDILAPMTSGQMVVLNKKRGEINKRIKNLDYNKGKYPPEEYHRMNNQLYIELHHVDEQQDAIVTRMENNIRRKYEGVGVKSAADALVYIKQNLLP